MCDFPGFRWRQRKTARRIRRLPPVIPAGIAGVSRSIHRRCRRECWPAPAAAGAILFLRWALPWLRGECLKAMLVLSPMPSLLLSVLHRCRRRRGIVLPDWPRVRVVGHA
jgi:hypothetical protein